MPRGYLKHNQGANTSKKQARGGSSRRKNKDTNNKKNFKAKSLDLHSRTQSSRHTTIIDDFTLPPIASTQQEKKDIDVGECSICFNSAPLISLSKKCHWHDAACKQCLRKLHVTNTKPQSYPLECYHPCCNQTVQVAQLKKHNIFNSAEEVQRHHELLVLAKIRKSGGELRTVRCYKCNAPRGVRVDTTGDTDHTYSCINLDCAARYLVSPYYATLRAIENLGRDSIGENEGWRHCPQCNILISKGEGCSHMECANCYHHFDWDECRRKTTPHAIVPDDEIYLWW